MKVLFITSTRIGDAVLSTSILNYLKNRFPHCSLYIATGKTAALLFKNFNNVKKIFILEKIYLDAPRYNINKLKEKLNLYKLNRDISISEKRIYSYFLFFGKLTNKTLGLSKKLGELKKVNSARIFNDPRNINLGSRIICNNKKDENKVIQIIKNKKIVLNSQEYEKQRILNCAPNIEKDNLYNKAYLLQYNFENLNSICWKKGCFVGQEVTIKMKKKGSLKKKLYVVKSLTKNLNSPKEIKFKNQLIGTTTSHCKNIALAIIQINIIKNIKKEKNILII